LRRLAFRKGRSRSIPLRGDSVATERRIVVRAPSNEKAARRITLVDDFERCVVAYDARSLAIASVGAGSSCVFGSTDAALDGFDSVNAPNPSAFVTSLFVGRVNR